jgi:hypothetical protein
MRGLGARSVTAAALLAGTIVTMWRMERFRFDYWAQLSPWVTFLAGGFAVVAGTLVFVYWRLAEPSHYYLRYGDKLPFGDETALVNRRGRTVIVGRGSFIDVADLPPRVMRALYIAIVFGIAMISLDNRAVALLYEVPSRFDQSSIDYCKPEEPAKPPEKPSQGCKLVERAYKLGYAKSLGSCAPAEAKREVQRACRRRQLDEPYLHYASRRLVDRLDALRTTDDSPSRLGSELDHLDAIVRTTLDTVAMSPRSSHHLFTNLADPRPTLRQRVDALLERGCGARLAHLPHFPRIDDPSLLLEHVLAQLVFNPSYKPIVAQCDEVVVHWDAPADACARLAVDPVAALRELGALDAVRDVLRMRATRLEMRGVDPARAREVPPAQELASFQCLVFDPATEAVAPIERAFTLDGEKFAVREARTKPLVADGSGQIRLYKQLAALMAPGFGYGRLTSNQAVDAAPEEDALANAFRGPDFLLTKLDLLRDADLFIGNDWLAKRPDLLEVYPYHLHLQNFIEIFRRQYKQHAGRL